MENALTYIKYAAALIGGMITAALGGWDKMLQVLVLFVILDYIVGLIAAWHEKRLDSTVGFKGITRKILLFVPIAVAVALDQMLGQEILRSLAIFFYLANEGLSILENLGRVGVPFPDGLVTALEQLKGKNDA